MARRTTGAPVADTISLLATPAALIGGLVLVAAQIGHSLAIALAIEAARPSGNYGLVGLAAISGVIVLFLVFGAVQFMLARRLGGSYGTAGTPGIASWISLVIFYFLANQLVSFLTPMVLNGAGLPASAVPVLRAAVSFAVRLLFFPVIVYMSALAHDGEACDFPDIISFLAKRGISWLVAYLALSLVLAGGLLAFTALTPHPSGESQGHGQAIVLSLFVAIGQLLSILFAIATYRAARASRDEDGPRLF